MRYAILLLVLAGCSASLVELRAERDELKEQAAKLAYEYRLLDRWDDYLEMEERAALKRKIDAIRGDEHINVCRDRKKAMLEKTMARLADVEKRIEAKL